MITYDNFTHLNIGPRESFLPSVVCLFVTDTLHILTVCVRACVRVRGACVRASERVWRVIALITLELELELACL